MLVCFKFTSMATMFNHQRNENTSSREKYMGFFSMPPKLPCRSDDSLIQV